MSNLRMTGAQGHGFWSVDVGVLGFNDLVRRLEAVHVYASNAGLWGQKFGKLMTKSLGDATATWSNGPRFVAEVRGSTAGSAEVAVRATGPAQARIFNFVDQGTRAHWIRPKPTNRAGVLVFNANFRAKSSPNSLQARGGFSGPPLAFSRGVWHPGVQARNFTTLAAEKAQEEGSQEVIEALEARWAGKLGG